MLELYWDNDRRKYVRKGDAPVGYAGPEKKKLLTDIGTRFQFLGDLQDYLGDGLAAVTASLARYANDSDQIRKTSLEATLTLVGIYQKQLAGWDHERCELNHVLDACTPKQLVMDEIKANNTKTRLAAIEALKTGADKPLLPEGPSHVDADEPPEFA